VGLRQTYRLVPVDGPAIVARVDVAGQALLVAVQLVGPAEVHLAGERGVVALAAQIVGVGGDVGGQVAGVVVGADLGGQLAGDHDEARGGAQRRVAVGIFEDDALAGQAVEVGGLDGGVLVVEGQQRGGHLVRHDVEDVGLFGGHGCCRRLERSIAVEEGYRNYVQEEEDGETEDTGRRRTKRRPGAFCTAQQWRLDRDGWTRPEARAHPDVRERADGVIAGAQGVRSAIATGDLVFFSPSSCFFFCLLLSLSLFLLCSVIFPLFFPLVYS